MKKTLFSLLLSITVTQMVFADTPENELSLVTYTPVKNSIIQPGKSAFLPLDLDKISSYPYNNQFVDCHISFDNGGSNEVPGASTSLINILWHTTTSQGETYMCDDLCKRRYTGAWGLKSWPATYDPITFDGLSDTKSTYPAISNVDDIIEIGYSEHNIYTPPFPEPGVTIWNGLKQTSITISDCKYSSYPTVLTNLQT